MKVKLSQKKFDASIIITTFAQADTLEVILYLLARQNTHYTFELIVAEDGGISDSINIVKRFSNTTNFSNIRYVWQQDKGFRAGQARNLAMRMAVGEYIILLDGDMLPGKGFISQHIDFHRSNPNSILSGGRQLISDEYTGKLKEKMDKNALFFQDLMALSYHNVEEEEYREKWFAGENSWMALFSCNLSFPNIPVARFNEQLLGWGIEDWEFCFHLVKNGLRPMFVPKLIAFHIDQKDRINNAFRKKDHGKMVEFARNLLIFIDQNKDHDLTVCAIALTRYRLNSKNNTWQWAGDTARLRTEKVGIALLRNWLINEKKYDEQSILHSDRERDYEVSIMVATYNHTDYLKHILYSLKNQSYRKPFQLIIAHDGSGLRHVKAGQRLLQKNEMPCYIIWQPKKGFRVASSRNNAISIATGKLLIMIDGDIIPEQDFITKHVRYSTEDEKLVVAGNRRLIGTEEIPNHRNTKYFYNKLKRRSKKFQTEEVFRTNIAVVEKYKLHPWRVGFTCNLSIKKRNEIIFDDNIKNRFGHEDLDLMYRLWKKGYSFKYDNNLVGYHIGYKKPGYGVHIGASSADLVNHGVTSMYVMNKYPDEPFMKNFCDCLRYFRLDKENRWYFSWNKKEYTTGLKDFSSWLENNPQKSSPPF